jgi:hypothetical protein
MGPEQQKNLQWLGDQHFEEQRALRAAEDNLFNWSSSLFLAGFGALTGFRGLSAAQWGFWWRVFVIIGVLALLGAILLMAYLIHRKYEQNQVALADIVARLNQSGQPPSPSRQTTGGGDDMLVFYLRWGALAVMGLITLVLVWMLG